MYDFDDILKYEENKVMGFPYYFPIMVWQLHEDKSQACIKLCYMRSNCLMHNCSRLMIYIICPCLKARTKLGILRKTTSFNLNKQTIICHLSHDWPINFLNKSIPALFH